MDFAEEFAREYYDKLSRHQFGAISPHTVLVSMLREKTLPKAIEDRQYTGAFYEAESLGEIENFLNKQSERGFTKDSLTVMGKYVYVLCRRIK